MAKFLPLLLLLIVLSGCGTSPSPKVDSSEVIGREIDTSMVVLTPPPKPASTAPSAAAAGAREVWKADDVIEWYSRYVKTEKGDSVGLQYQGSNASFHFFIARIPSTSGWMKFSVSKSEVTLTKELPDQSNAVPIHGYGFVDPYHGFRFLPHTAMP